jgi:hypothetical protein
LKPFHKQCLGDDEHIGPAAPGAVNPPSLVAMSVPRYLKEEHSLLAVFKDKLENEWRHNTVCGRYVINTRALKAWMARKDTEKNMTNAGALLRIVELRRPGTNRFSWVNPPRMLGEESFVLVFSILLQLGQGHLIEVFADAKIVDKNLDSLRNHQKQLEDELCNKGVTDFDIKEFERAKWPFCTAEFTLDMRERFTHDRFTGGNYIMPYCVRKRVNNSHGVAKGGTATVSQVAIQKDLLTDEGFRKKIDNAKFEHPQYGVVSREFLFSCDEEPIID